MASKINKGEILAKFFDDGEYTALFADGAVSAACGYAAGQQAYAVYQNGEAVTVKDVEKNIKVLEMAAQTGCPVVTFYNSVGAKLAEGLDVLTVSAKLNAQIAKVSGVIPQVSDILFINVIRKHPYLSAHLISPLCRLAVTDISGSVGDSLNCSSHASKISLSIST